MIENRRGAPRRRRAFPVPPQEALFSRAGGKVRQREEKKELQKNMQNFVISSDSTCDLYADYVKAQGIRIVCLSYIMEQNGALTEAPDDFQSYGEYVDFYRKLREGGFSRTSMLNYEKHFEHFRAIVEEGGEEIIHFSLSSGLSPTANVAKDAARGIEEKYPGTKVLVVDSLAATIGSGALVKEAVRLRGAGKSLQETFDAVSALPLHIQYCIIANDLFYLKKGGRVSAVAAAAGSLLQVKPVLSFTREGKLTVVEKCRGMKKAFAYTLAKTEKLPHVEEERMMWIVHTDAEDQANELADMVEARWNFRPDVTIMGPVIGSHVGPGSVSMIWKTKEERGDG